MKTIPRTCVSSCRVATAVTTTAATATATIATTTTTTTTVTVTVSVATAMPARTHRAQQRLRCLAVEETRHQCARVEEAVQRRVGGGDGAQHGGHIPVLRRGETHPTAGSVRTPSTSPLVPRSKWGAARARSRSRARCVCGARAAAHRPPRPRAWSARSASQPSPHLRRAAPRAWRPHQSERARAHRTGAGAARTQQRLCGGGTVPSVLARGKVAASTAAARAITEASVSAQ